MATTQLLKRKTRVSKRRVEPVRARERNTAAGADDAREEDEWDRQIARASAAGKLDYLADRALEAYRSGNVRPL